MFSTILVTVDGSGASSRGLSTAIALAVQHRAVLCVLHVVEGMPASWSHYVGAEFRPKRMDLLLQGLRASGQRLLDEARAVAHDREQPTELLLVDARGRSFAEVTLAEARRIGADVVVLGTHGRDGVSRFVHGSEAESLLRRSDIPVLLVRGDAHPENARPPVAAVSARPNTAAARGADTALAAH
jgi:nucleotide-binding universal stress UspA family protein